MLIILIISDQNFAHANAMTAELSWHVQNCDLIGTNFVMQEPYAFLRDLNNELIDCWWNGSQVSLYCNHVNRELIFFC